ncbi:MAG: MazG family protein [Actinobacteria bacterium]|nr:MazG family protein [Actinomycetota bacterium]
MSDSRSPRIVYIGADAAVAPASSLRALAGAGTVLVPAGLSAELRRLIATAAGGRLHEVQADEALRQLQGGSCVAAAAGPHGPRLARALLAAAAQVGVTVNTVPAQPLFDDCLVAQQLASLQRITRTLRAQCPWDRVQTAGDIVSYSLEEMYELADAIAEGDLEQEHGELGDVLFQVYFLALLLQEQQAGDLGSVAAAIERKLIRRHPHIFADAVADTPAAVRGRWEAIKREQEGREGIFHDVPKSLPALLYARKLQRRAAEVGFDWETALEAFPKIAEEHAELAQAMAAHGHAPEFDAPAAPAGGAATAPRESEASSPQQVEMRHDPHVRHEIGDLLFAVVNVARKAGIDPELALREAVRRFECRVSTAAELASGEGVDWSAVGLERQEHYYQRAKLEEKEGQR